MNESITIYGFGLYFNDNKKHNDIDLLIIHERIEFDSCQFAIWCKRVLLSKIDFIHVSILSIAEEEQCSFISKSEAKFIGEIHKKSCKEDIIKIIDKIKANKNFFDLKREQ